MSTPTAKVVEGNLVATGQKLAIIASRWNNFITDRLVEGALDCIARHGGDLAQVTVYKVPGCFELPLAAKKAAASGRYDGVIALGVLIRGATPHFDYICSQATSGLSSAGLSTDVPVSFGVLTVDTIEQAIERAGTKAGNKGEEATLATVEMVNLLAQM